MNPKCVDPTHEHKNHKCLTCQRIRCREYRRQLRPVLQRVTEKHRLLNELLRQWR